jgi:hypothetical protein
VEVVDGSIAVVVVVTRDVVLVVGITEVVVVGCTVVVVASTAEVVLVSIDVVVELTGRELVVVVGCTVVVVVGGTVVLVVCIVKVAFIFSSCAGLDKRVVISILHSPAVAPFWIVSGTNMNLPKLNTFLRILRLTP